MHERTTRNAINRREFLGAASGAAAAALTAGPLAASALGSVGEGAKPISRHLLDPSVPKKKIPIGVFDPVYADLSLDQMLDRVSVLGLEAMEIGTGGYPGASHCPVAELLADVELILAEAAVVIAGHVGGGDVVEGAEPALVAALAGELEHPARPLHVHLARLGQRQREGLSVSPVAPAARPPTPCPIGLPIAGRRNTAKR